nr:MAG TPA: hypothetical protein [Microviridae sp.]
MTKDRGGKTSRLFRRGTHVTYIMNYNVRRFNKDA